MSTETSTGTSTKTSTGTTTGRPATPRAADRSWRDGYLVGLTALTAYCTGVSWQAQLVSYPLYRAVAPADFPAYHLAYNAAIPLPVVVPGFLCFLACGAFVATRPREVPRALAALVSLTGIGSLVTTVAWAIPRHDRLDAIGQDAATITSLLQANTLRTALLTAGTAALVASVARVLRRRAR